MKQLKKTLLTLVALLALTTHAWAEETLLVTIYASDDFKSGSKTFDNKVTVTFSNFVYYDGEEGWYADGDPSLLTVAGTNGYTITSCKFYTANGEAETGYTIEGKSPSVYLSASTEVYTDANQSVYLGYQGITKIEVYGTAPSASSGPKVAWDKDKKTGKFTMPGGNVTLEPEYYPQAALTAAPTAINDVPATTDGAIVNAGTVKNIGETTTAQGTVMYYVSPSALDDDALLALAADQWTADVPTAKSLAQGQAYVYYYVKGNDSTDDALNFSDGDICATALTVTIGAAPTYAVEFAEGTEESDKWSAEPNADVEKGQTVTVTYNGSKKVIGVKAEKKAAPAETTVTLTPGEIGDLTSGSNSKTINGITIEVSGDANFHSGNGVMEVSASDPDTGEPVPTTGTFTFTSSVGNIKRIDINHNGGNWWGSGDGWPGSYEVYHSSTFTWSGTPAASVTLNGSGNDMDNCTFVVSSFVFTIEPTN